MSIKQQRRYTPNEFIFREGDTGECAYLIESGSVLVFLTDGKDEMPLRILGDGEVFGEMSLIDGSPRSASCRAIGHTNLIIVTKDQLLDRVRSADAVVRLLLQALLERLRAQNDLLRGKPTSGAPKIDSLAEEKKEVLQRIELEIRIANGLDNDEFHPYYQPIYDLNTGSLMGCEALLRWHSKDKGMISPGVFMDVMEESSLILRAGKMVIEKSLRDLNEMKKVYKNPDFFVSINVSGRQFMDATFLQHLESVREQYGMPATQVKMELTERVMTECLPAMSTLHQLRGLGYLLAIDDFGTGFSSLQYLANMPLTDLKIDRSFIMTMLSDNKSLSIIKFLINMAANLGLSLTAEGIENKNELALLRNLNVSLGQGFLFSKAIPLADFLKLGQLVDVKAA